MNGLEHVCQAIQRERESRGYKVMVTDPMHVSSIAGVQLPSLVEAYAVTTTCTIKHDHGIPCRWVDWLFLLPIRLDGKPYRVVLQSELLRPGLCLEHSVHALCQELQSAWN